jgi:hypothetical protein
MARKSTLVFILLLLLLAFPRSASVTPQHFQGPPDFQRDVSAGRPGTFRFVTNEQLRADRLEIADLRAAMDRMHRLLPAVKDAYAQREISAELERWSLHVARLEQRMNSSAGPTAASVEAHLNQAKGTRQCGVCHGAMPEGPMRTMY